MHLETDSFLKKRLRTREAAGSLRALTHLPSTCVDFTSNDTLGFARDHISSKQESPRLKVGSTGSRLLSGNSIQAEQLENQLAQFHHTPAALIFNSGYDANLGLFSSLLEEGDYVFYDDRIHASVHDGMKLGRAKSFSFKHNQLTHLEQRLERLKKNEHISGTIFVAVESVYSMDGDFAPLQDLVTLAEKHGFKIIVDEAHTTGWYGPQGEGLTQALGLQQKIFARVHTFGKALGCHGAAVVGSVALKHYLINFARSLIYSTALSEHTLQTISNAYNALPHAHAQREKLTSLIRFFCSRASECPLPLTWKWMLNPTPIQGLIIPSPEHLKQVTQHLIEQNLDVRAIKSPTVPRGEERIRICLHSFNTESEINALLLNLSKLAQRYKSQ